MAVAKVVLTAEAKGGQGARRGAGEGSWVHLRRGVKTAEPQPGSLWGVSQRWQHSTPLSLVLRDHEQPGLKKYV